MAHQCRLCDKFSILSLLMGEMGSWGRVYVKRMYVRGTWPVSHSITSSPQPPVTEYRKPPGGPGGGGGRPSSFPWKEAPGGSCDRMRSDAPPQPPGTSRGRARFSRELPPRGRIELPRGVWGSSPPASHCGAVGRSPEWAALKSFTFPGRETGCGGGEIPLRGPEGGREEGVR